MKMSKLKEITEGWKNVVFPTPQTEKIALSRAIICSGCAHQQAGACLKCGCLLVAKTRNMKSKCPINKW